MNGNSNCSSSGGPRLNPFLSCFVGQALALYALQRDLRAVRIVVAKLDASIVPKIEFGQVTVEMLAIDMLVDADNAALKHAEKALKRIRMHITARPFKLGMVNCFMLRRASEFKDRV